MTKSLIQEYVVSAIADDYESLEIILQDVNKWAAEYGSRIKRQEVIRALEQLIRQGYAQAYILSPQPPYAQSVELTAEDVEKLWFYVTPKGKRLVENLRAPPGGESHDQ